MIQLLVCLFTVTVICLGFVSRGRLFSPGNSRSSPMLVLAQTVSVPAGELTAQRPITVEEGSMEALRRLQQELDATQAALRTTQQDVQVAQQEGTTARQQLQATQAELRQWQERHAALEETRASLFTRLQQTAASEAEARQRLQRVDGELTTLRAQIQEAHNMQWNQNDELARLRQALAGEQQTLGQLRHELSASLNALSTARQRLQSTETKHQEQTVQVRSLGEQLQQRLALAGQGRMVVTQIHGDHVRLQVPHDAAFLTRGATMRHETHTFLNTLAAFLKEYPAYELRVEGHTDAVPIRTSSRQKWPTNWEMSGARAAAVVRYLEGQGLPPERLVLGGYGASRPLTSNATSDGQAQNRRLEFMIRLPSTT